MPRPKHKKPDTTKFLDANGHDTREGPGISASEFARRLGVSPSHISSWLKRGRIFRNNKGEYIWPHCRNDLEASKKRQVMQSDELRAATARRKAEAKGQLTPEPPGETGKPSIAITQNDLHSTKLIRWLVEAMERQQASALSGTYQFAKAFEQLLKVEKAQTAMLVERGELVARKAVEDTAAESARHKRNVWLNTPERIAVEFAEEAGIDRRLAYDLLTKHVVATLEMIAGSADAVLADAGHDAERPAEDEQILVPPNEDEDEPPAVQGGGDTGGGEDFDPFEEDPIDNAS